MSLPNGWSFLYGLSSEIFFSFVLKIIFVFRCYVAFEVDKYAYNCILYNITKLSVV